MIIFQSGKFDLRTKTDVCDGSRHTEPRYEEFIVFQYEFIRDISKREVRSPTLSFQPGPSPHAHKMNKYRSALFSKLRLVQSNPIISNPLETIHFSSVPLRGIPAQQVWNCKWNCASNQSIKHPKPWAFTLGLGEAHISPWIPNTDVQRTSGYPPRSGPVTF